MRERMPLVVGLVAGVLLAGCGAEGGQQSTLPTHDAAPSTTAPSASSPEATPRPEATLMTPTSVGHAAIEKDVIITFYASYDNDPPGSKEVAHTNIQAEAGGTGTYEDPLTLAARSDVSDVFKPGARVYVPFLEKYFVRSDDCGESEFAPDGCETQVDLYMGNPSDKKAVLDCEDALTPDGKQPVIIDPPENLPVSAQPLWDDRTGKCFNQ